MTTFPYTPDELSGDWIVRVPPDASIGEVLVYATPIEVPTAFLRWPCWEGALPLEEINGFPHELVTALTGSPGFGRPTMRDDTAGAAISNSSSVTHFDGYWSPAIFRSGTDFTLAALLARDVGSLADSVGIVELSGIGSFDLHSVAGVDQPADFNLYDGVTGPSGYKIVHTYAGGATAGQDFLALRVSAGGVWKAWLGDYTATGTESGWDPTSTWTVRTYVNDFRVYKFMEIHVWPGVASDADIEAVRLSLTGV